MSVLSCGRPVRDMSANNATGRTSNPPTLLYGQRSEVSEQCSLDHLQNSYDARHHGPVGRTELLAREDV